MEGASSSGSSEARSMLERRLRRDSMAKQTTKMPAKHELTRMVRARTSMGRGKQGGMGCAPHALRLTARILRECAHDAGIGALRGG